MQVWAYETLPQLEKSLRYRKMTDLAAILTSLLENNEGAAHFRAAKDVNY